MKYTCVRCGKQFESKHKTAVCTDCHTAVCVICGKIFTLTHPYTQQTCSSACRGKYRKISGIAQKVADQAKDTLSRRHDGMNLRQVQSSKIYHKTCKYCKQPFETHNPRQVYCKRIHYGKCPVCGNPSEIKELYLGHVPCCSNKCKQVKIAETCQRRYNHKCALASDYCQAKARRTVEAKLGVQYVAQTREYHVKCARTRYSSVASDGTRFDSKYELALYEYLNTAAVTCSTQIPLYYHYQFDRRLFIDFNIDNRFYECKGGHLFNSCYANTDMTHVLLKFRLYYESNAVIITDIYGIRSVQSHADPYVSQLQCIDIALFQKPLFEPRIQWEYIQIALLQNIQFITRDVICSIAANLSSLS